MYSTTARAYIHLQTKHLSFLVLDDIVDIEIVAKKHKTSEEAMVEDVLKDLKKELFLLLFKCNETEFWWWFWIWIWT